MIPIEDLDIRNTDMKYESPITYHSKDMANVKVFADRKMDKPKTICPCSFNTWNKKIFSQTLLYYTCSTITSVEKKKIKLPKGFRN
jgi:hypothetical protein